jgi:PAS domain S-box-containing protein
MIDVRTVIISYTLSAAVCAAVIAYLWFDHRKRFRGLGFWLAGYVMEFVGILLLALRTIVPDFWSIVAGNVLVLAGIFSLFLGLERFVDKRTAQIHNYILLAAFFIVHSYFTFVRPNLLARNLNASAGLFLLGIQGAWLMLHRVEENMRRIARIVGIVSVGYCLAALGRILGDLTINPGYSFLRSDAFDTLIILLQQMLFIALTFSLYIMVNRRLVLNLEADIFEREQMENALRVSEEKFYTAFHSSPDAIVISRMSDGKFIEVNDGFVQMSGYSREEALSNSALQLGIWANPQDREVAIAALRENQRFQDFEYDFLTKSGPVRNCLVSGEIIQLDNEAHILWVTRDITERKNMNDALRYRNDILAALNQVTLDLVNRHEVNDILQTLLLKSGDLLDAPQVSVDLLEEDDVLITYAATLGQPLQVGDRMRRGEGGWLSWQAIDSGQPAVLEDYSTWSERRSLYEGFPIRAIMIIPIHHREQVIGTINISRNEANRPFNDTDIYVAKQLAQMAALVLYNAQLYAQLQSELGERIRNEDALHEAQAELVAQQRMVAVLEERQRLARDLHDSLSQSIHSLVLFSETLVATIEKNNFERARQIVGRLQESAWQSHKETRLLLYELQASGPSRGVDLLRDLEERLAKVERHAGVRAQIVVEGSLENCPPEWHENLFWITIEALNNMLKHAQARKVQVLIRSFPDRIELEVSDNGKGFDPEKVRTGGMGVDNMHDRASLLGGNLTIETHPGKGTRVCFSAEIRSSENG